MMDSKKNKSFVCDPVNSLSSAKEPALKPYNSNPFSFSNFSLDFDDHISQSIRGYSFLRNDVVSISKYFVEEKTSVMDLGCSQGSLLRKIYEFNDHVSTTQYIGIDINHRFSQYWTEEKNLKYVIDDIITMQFSNNLSMVVSLFTLQFIPERHRISLMKKIYDNLIEGGVFIFSEKVFSLNSKIQNMIEFIYFDYKKQFFTEKEILDKEKELRHLAKLNNEDSLTTQLLSVGFRQIQPFWRNHNFVGIIALKLPKNNIDEQDFLNRYSD